MEEMNTPKVFYSPDDPDIPAGLWEATQKKCDEAVPGSTLCCVMQGVRYTDDSGEPETSSRLSLYVKPNAPSAPP